MKSGHGGRRSGAGRKPVLHLWDRIAVGAEFEQRWLEAQKDEAWDKYYAVRRYADAELKIEKIQQDNRNMYANLTQPHHKGVVRKRLLANRQKLMQIDRWHSALLKRPKGQRAAVIDDVVEWWNERFPGSEITPRYVAKCIVEYRELLVRDSKTPT
jgi:hypothetical protein